MTKSIPKLGDKFAVLSGYGTESISGPFYVVGIRSSRVALALDPKPDPKASRGWRASHDGSLTDGSHRFNSSRAVPWTEEHQLKCLRDARARGLFAHLERLLRSRIEGFSIEQIDAMYRATAIMPEDLVRAIERIETEGLGSVRPEQFERLRVLDFIRDHGVGVAKKWTVTDRGIAAYRRTTRASLPTRDMSVPS